MAAGAAIGKLFSLNQDTALVIALAAMLLGGVGYWILLLWLSERAADQRTYGALVRLTVVVLLSAVVLPLVAAWVAAF